MKLLRKKENRTKQILSKVTAPKIDSSSTDVLYIYQRCGFWSYVTQRENKRKPSIKIFKKAKNENKSVLNQKIGTHTQK